MWATRIGVGSFVFLASAVVLSAGTPLPAASADDECSPSCESVKKSCVEAARTAYRSCRLECGGAESRKACQRSCRLVFQDADQSCRTARADCRDACRMDPPASECMPCERELRDCLQDVLESGRGCTDSCNEQAYGDYISRGRAPSGDRPDAGDCLHGCAGGMTDSADDCQADHGDCREQCE